MNHRTTSLGQRAAALLATLSAGTLLVIACSSAPPPVQAGPGDNDSATGGDVAVGIGVDATGGDSSSSSGGNDGTIGTVDSSAPADDGPSKGPVDSSTYADLTQAFDAASLPDANSLDSTLECGFVNCGGGCCDMNGTCQTTLSNTVCGGEGNPCMDCTQTGQTCGSSKTCQ
jgi:hypothetical protein